MLLIGVQRSLTWQDGLLPIGPELTGLPSQNAKLWMLRILFGQRFDFQDRRLLQAMAQTPANQIATALRVMFGQAVRFS